MSRDSISEQLDALRQDVRDMRREASEQSDRFFEALEKHGQMEDEIHAEHSKRLNILDTQVAEARGSAKAVAWIAMGISTLAAGALVFERLRGFVGR